MSSLLDLSAMEGDHEYSHPLHRSDLRAPEKAGRAAAEHAIDGLNPGKVQTIKQITGDYRRGASRFWTENDKRTFPVSDVSVHRNSIC